MKRVPGYSLAGCLFMTVVYVYAADAPDQLDHVIDQVTERFEQVLNRDVEPLAFHRMPFFSMTGASLVSIGVSGLAGTVLTHKSFAACCLSTALLGTIGGCALLKLNVTLRNYKEAQDQRHWRLFILRRAERHGEHMLQAIAHYIQVHDQINHLEEVISERMYEEVAGRMPVDQIAAWVENHQQEAQEMAQHIIAHDPQVQETIQARGTALAEIANSGAVVVADEVIEGISSPLMNGYAGLAAGSALGLFAASIMWTFS